MIRRGVDGPDAQPQAVAAGETATLSSGDAVIQNSGAAHQAHNYHDESVMIRLSTLFPTAALRSEPAEATPTP